MHVTSESESQLQSWISVQFPSRMKLVICSLISSPFFKVFIMFSHPWPFSLTMFIKRCCLYTRTKLTHLIVERHRHCPLRVGVTFISQGESKEALMVKCWHCCVGEHRPSISPERDWKDSLSWIQTLHVSEISIMLFLLNLMDIARHMKFSTVFSISMCMCVFLWRKRATISTRNLRTITYLG